MKNNFFEFKQFTVQQDRCAMKVSTDACLFGAWVAQTVQELQLSCNSVLDIGTGTGLLALMLAQKTSAQIVAVEMEGAACEQAMDNTAASNWAQRIKVVHADIKAMQTEKKYDLIISNPPFYENSLLSPDAVSNHAKHSQALTLQQLLQAVNNYIEPAGHFAVLLPYQRTVFFKELAFAEGYHLLSLLLVRHSLDHPISRSCLLFSRNGGGLMIREEMVIKQRNHYTGKFIELLKDYYLYL